MRRANLSKEEVSDMDVHPVVILVVACVIVVALPAAGFALRRRIVNGPRRFQQLPAAKEPTFARVKERASSTSTASTQPYGTPRVPARLSTGRRSGHSPISTKRHDDSTDFISPANPISPIYGGLYAGESGSSYGGSDYGSSGSSSYDSGGGFSDNSSGSSGCD